MLVSPQQKAWVLCPKLSKHHCKLPDSHHDVSLYFHAVLLAKSTGMQPLLVQAIGVGIDNMYNIHLRSSACARVAQYSGCLKCLCSSEQYFKLTQCSLEALSLAGRICRIAHDITYVNSSTQQLFRSRMQNEYINGIPPEDCVLI